MRMCPRGTWSTLRTMHSWRRSSSLMSMGSLARCVKRTLVGDVRHLAEDRKQLRDRLPEQLGAVGNRFGQVGLGAPLGLHGVLVAPPAGLMGWSVDVEPADGSTTGDRHVQRLRAG